MADLSVIIPAAGSGTRIGGDIPKPFIRIGKKSILEHTIARFDKPELVSEIIIPVSKEWLSHVKNVVDVSNFSIPVRFVTGGVERMYSIYNALLEVDAQSHFIAIHDAVRPFFSDELLHRLIDGVKKHGAVIPGVQVTDTIKIVDRNNLVTETPDRATLYAVQTPQCFRRVWIMQAYELAIKSNYFGTDDAALCETAGYSVRVIDGERDNFKITWAEDLRKAEQKILDRMKYDH